MSNSSTVIVDDDEGKERLTNKEFLDLIPHLQFSQVLQTEVLVNDEWKPLISQIRGIFANASAKTSKTNLCQMTYCCTICGVFQTQPKNMMVHIGGKKHIAHIKGVKDIFHPVYTGPKSTENKAQNGNANTSQPKQKEPIKSVDQQKDSPEPAPTSQDKKMVLNPLKLKRANDATTKPTESNAAKNLEKPKVTESITDTNEIPEVIIIDDNEDEKPVECSPQNKTQPEPPVKKPKIMVSSFAKCVESADEESDNNKDESATIQDKVKSNTAVEDKNKIHGFVGVEYVVKISGEQKPTRYECGLCELNLGFDDMQKHLLGYSHRLKFCEKHFPTAIQQFRQYIVDVPADEHYKVMIPVLQKLAEAIEKHHGRAQPFDCIPSRFKEKRIRVLTEVFERAHASEQEGPTFTHVVNSKDVDQFISKRHDSSQQEKILNVPVFDNMQTVTIAEAGAAATAARIPLVNRKPKVDNTPIVKMANAMRMHFQVSQPYHYEGPFPPPPYMEPQPYMSQQQFAHAQPYMGQPYAQPQHFVQQEPQFIRQPAVDDETHKRMVDRFLRANNKDGHSSSSRSNRHDRYDRSSHRRDGSRSSRSSRSPHRSSSSFSSHSKPQSSNSSHDIWRTYCRLVDHKMNALNERFKQYRTHPESHPSYKDEWLKFWHRRKSELITSGQDYRTYDYQPDWVAFFNNRIKELYDEECESLKIQSREELSLPMTNDFVSETKYFVREKRTENKEKDKPIVPFDNFNLAPFVEPSITKPVIPPNSVPLADERSTFTKQRSSGTSRIEDDETPTFVSVLRLLTALEEHLGSLGPKIVDLLTKALQAEKSSPSRGLALINEENCTLVETAMEKFKGLVIAGILDSAKERALKKAITKVSAFLEIARQTRELVAKRPAPTPRNEVDDTLRKTQIVEEKIAAAMAAQGHSFDKDKLEQLATVCVLLDRKKREAAAAAAAATSSSNNSATATRSENSRQKPLSDALSDIMGNFGSAGVTANKPSSSAVTDPRIGRSSAVANKQYSHSSSSSIYANSNSMNSARNVGNTYNDNVSNYASRSNRDMNFDEATLGWQHQQQQQPQQPNMTSYNWNQDPNRAWGTNQRPAYYPNQPNEPLMRRNPYM